MNRFIPYILKKSFYILILICISHSSIKGQDELEEISDEEWDLIKDKYAEAIIKLKLNLQVLNEEIDSLKSISVSKDMDIEKCENDLMALVGHTKSSVADFRKKFEETEKKINSKSGTPADARKMYFDEVTNDKARCLPEFADRYASMKKKLLDWEGVKVEAGYTVVKGDCLWKIAKMKYGNPYLWPAIWDANRDGVVNKDQLSHPGHKAIREPNLIYPGQIITIPLIPDERKKKIIYNRKVKRKKN
ncbi:MAG: LysM peptidoglycan-binding domain-containing protein [Ignavibacteria bacterium]